MNLFELFVKIGVDDSGVEKGVRDAVASFAKLSGEAQKTVEAVENVSDSFSDTRSDSSTLEKGVQNLSEEFEKAEEAADDFTEEIEDMGGEIETTGGKVEKGRKLFSNFASAIGSGLATAAKVGTAAVGAASTGIAALTKSAVDNFSEFEQLVGGAEKIFDELDQSEILDDANNAYKELNMSAIQYLSIINDVGASFSSTMGDAKGYDTAVQGLKAISDYATGTGKSVDELTGKFTLITRSTSSYQSIADQFSGILPATSAAFLEQAQAAGVLEKSYKQLTDVPLNEYQAAVAAMLESGVEKLGLASNTVLETEKTISGSAAAMKASWSNLVTSLADDTGDFETAFRNFTDSAGSFLGNVVPRIEVAVQGVSSLVESAAEKLPDFLGYAITGINEQLTKEDGILASGAKIVGTLFDAVVTNAPTLLDTGVDILTNVAQGVTGKLEDGTLQSATNSIIDTAVDFLTDKDGKLTEFAGAAGEMVEALGDYIVESSGKLAEGLSEIVLYVSDWFTKPENLMSLQGVGETINETIGSGIDSFAYVAGKHVTSLYTNIFDAVKNSDWSAIGDYVKSALSNVTAIDEIIGAGTAFVEGITGAREPLPLDEYLESARQHEKEVLAELNNTAHGDPAWMIAQQAAGAGTASPVGDGWDGIMGENFGARNVYNNTFNVYTQAKTEADLAEEIVYQQERAALAPQFANPMLAP